MLGGGVKEAPAPALETLELKSDHDLTRRLTRHKSKGEHSEKIKHRSGSRFRLLLRQHRLRAECKQQHDERLIGLDGRQEAWPPS